MNQQAPDIALQFLNLFAHRVRAELDPPEHRPRAPKPGHVGAITRILRALGDDQFQEFATPKSRTAALNAARSYLSPILQHEELLVFVGRRRAERRDSGSSYYGVWKCVGDRNGVQFSPSLQRLIAELPHTDRADVLFVHNHPPNWLKNLVGTAVPWRPTASETDRNTALVHEVQATLAGIRRGFGTASFRWYLVEEGEIREFGIPGIGSALEFLKDPTATLQKLGVSI